jgi:predicted membrane protein
LAFCFFCFSVFLLFFFLASTSLFASLFFCLSVFCFSVFCSLLWFFLRSFLFIYLLPCRSDWLQGHERQEQQIHKEQREQHR